MNGFITKHTFFSVECAGCSEYDENTATNTRQAVEIFKKRGWQKIGNYWYCHSCVERYTTKQEKAD